MPWSPSISICSHKAGARCGPSPAGSTTKQSPSRAVSSGDALVFALVLVPLMTGLGFWQLQRAEEKRVLADAFAAREVQPPTPLGQLWQARAQALAYLPVSLTEAYLQRLGTDIKTKPAVPAEGGAGPVEQAPAAGSSASF